MKHINTFKLFESLHTVRKKAIINNCIKYKIKNYIINDDLSIDVHTDVYLHDLDIKHKLPIKFNKVYGNFECVGCDLITLEGCPKYVKETFNCRSNKLTSLEHGPEYVGGDYDCSYNELTTLKGAPNNIEYNFWCLYNKLTTLEFGPSKVEGNYDCTQNELVSLEGCGEVYGVFDCMDNQLLNLNGVPLNAEDIVTENNPVNSLISFIRKTISSDDVAFYELLERMEEFEVVRGETLDTIKMEQMYDFLGFKLDRENLIRNTTINNFYTIL